MQCPLTALVKSEIVMESSQEGSQEGGLFSGGQKYRKLDGHG